MHRSALTTIMLTTLLSAVCIAVSSQSLRAEAPEPVVFYAMGDVPRSPAEDELLPQQIAALPDDAQFVVHVGDIKSGGTACDEAVYVKVSGMLRKAAVPTFIIPGDNEWNDCDSPDQAWEYWQQSFTRFDQHWQHRLGVFRQLEREENFSMLHHGVLFVGINLVGGRVQDADEWKQRHADNIAWVLQNLDAHGDAADAMVLFGHAQPRPDHDDFFEPFVARAQQWGKPVLYLHGDGHRWLKDRPFDAEKILRVQIDQGGIAPPPKVTVTAGADEPFVFDRRK